jgi:hypothetical protein
MSWSRWTLTCVLACAIGCGCGEPVTAATVGASRTAPGPVTLPAPWPERGILRESSELSTASQVFDPGTDTLYALVPRTLTSYVLLATNLRTGAVRQGQSYPAPELVLASGYLWVCGYSGSTGRHTALTEVDPGTLRMVRSVAMSGLDPSAGVTAGPAGSVWTGSGRTLLRVSVRTGAVLARAVLAAGLELTNVAASPADRYLYASATRIRQGGAAVFEYSADTGRLLVEAYGAPTDESVGGANLAPVPGAVWVSFRTGMLGGSGLLSARSLSVIGGFNVPTNPANSPTTGPGTIYDWPQTSTAAYTGRALLVATGGGLVACVSPVTGEVQTQETVTAQEGVGALLLAVDSTTREAVAIISTPGYTGLVTISPPRSCWT